MLFAKLHKVGVHRWHLQATSLSAVGLSLALWTRAKTVDQSSRANAERRAIFVGLWPPMLWLLGDAVGE